MKCQSCKVDKLSNEFPADTISQKCSHVSSFCLRCIMKYLDVPKNPIQQKCPECKVFLSRQEFNDLNLAWDKASFRVDVSELKTINKNNLDQGGVAKGDFYVVLLNGTKLSFKLEKIKTVEALREAIKKQTNVATSKQKLIHKGVELQNFSTQGLRIRKQLSDYSITANSHVQLMVLLYSISKALSINALTFDLFWEYPSNECDFLDGTCMLYKGTGRDSKLYRVFDYNKRNFADIPMSHSGDVMDNTNKRGHHRITANLASMPYEVTKLYFILSAFRSPSIGYFPNPSFRMVDPSNPSVQLCSYTIQSAATSQAVVMCVVEKSEEGNWNVFEIGKLSDGNVWNYPPIINTISDMDRVL